MVCTFDTFLGADTTRHMITAAAAVAVAVPLLAGMGVGLSIKDETRGWWYTYLRKPWWTPPRWLFGPVWTVLYILMGIASYRALSKTTNVWAAAVPYALQLGLNLWWSILFFRNRDLRGASAEVLALLLAVLATVWSFARLDTTAALLMVPYAAWTTFAAALTLSVASLNPSPPGAGRRAPVS